jgi:outer membrane protein
MKKLIILCVALIVGLTATAQKFGYVNTETILAKLPEYQAAQKEIDKTSIEEQKKIERKYSTLDSMYEAYAREEVLLTEEMKAKRQNAIMNYEKEVKSYQKKIFGFEGRIFLLRQDLIKPVQDKVMAAVEKVAKKHKLQVVFDKAGDLTMLYTSSIHDYTDYVLEELEEGDPVDTVDNERYKEKENKTKTEED